MYWARPLRSAMPHLSTASRSPRGPFMWSVSPALHCRYRAAVYISLRDTASYRFVGCSPRASQPLNCSLIQSGITLAMVSMIFQLCLDRCAGVSFSLPVPLRSMLGRDMSQRSGLPMASCHVLFRLRVEFSLQHKAPRVNHSPSRRTNWMFTRICHTPRLTALVILNWLRGTSY